MNIKKQLVNGLMVICLIVAGFNGAYASAVGGPKETTTRVRAYGTDRFQAVKFYGGETAMVAVIGDGTTDLDLYVYDDNGNLIVSDEDNSDNCIVRWTPKWTGNFYIVVKNNGNIWNQYTMSTN